MLGRLQNMAYVGRPNFKKDKYEKTHVKKRYPKLF